MNKKVKTLTEVSQCMFASMKKLGYAERTIESYRLLHNKFIMYAAELGYTDLTPELMDGYIAKFAESYPGNSKNDRKRNAEIHRLMDMLQDCSLHGTILRHKLSVRHYLEPYKNEIAEFQKFGKEKGLSDASIERICQVISRLSAYIYQKDILSFSDMKREDLHGFIKTQSGFARKTMAACMYSLRVLILFLNETDKNHALDRDDVPRIKYVSRRSMPKVWSEDECRKLLSVVDTGTPRGKRDYAILMLVINTGMRQCDILNLKFENINWYEHTIEFVQQKTGTANHLHLDDATGWAIIDYLKNGRPENDICTNVFLRHRAPFVPLESFYTVLTRYLKLADIHVQPETMHGMHSLRHSLASRMLREDIPIGTIADIMGHASIQSTKDYLQIDTEHLRGCALEVDI